MSPASRGASTASASASAAQIDTSRTWDIATLGVRRDFRGGKLMVGLAMYHAIMKSTRINEVATATAIMDEHAHRVLSGAGYLFTTLPGTRPAPYLGSESSIPVYGHWAGLADAQRRTNPDAYRLVTLGIGLDGIAVPEDSAFELRSRLASVPELVDAGSRAGVAAWRLPSLRPTAAVRRRRSPASRPCRPGAACR